MTREVPTGVDCIHPKMKQCCDGCGHWSCPDCGLEYDMFSGAGYFDEEGNEIPMTGEGELRR